MVKAILFDFWGTIVENGVFPSPSRQVQEILRLNVPFPEFVHRFEEAFMTKEFDSLQDAFSAVFSGFEIKENKVEMEELIGLWNKNKLLAKPFQESVGVLEELSKSYKLFLVANSNKGVVDEVVDKYDLRKYFTDVFLSCELGFLKTDPEFFSAVLEKHGLKKEDCLMVGDSLQSDVEAAGNVGIAAVLVDRRDRRSYERKIITLDGVKRWL
tara:strand:- start:180 stop:815 length:636 start_codon:yes stop_codon:yes gene_type:complete